MKRLFDELAYEVSKRTTEKYSTSFSLGILALKPCIRNSIYAIYGYVRLADEIVDSFHGLKSNFAIFSGNCAQI
ncbi:squalene/phytoene synthase family protein [Sphingobacterium siyangense]|uniref:squalene/phytoene synthase family protein n=1 Tax=Sphingobacterium siyangense TaxID=459529 RepID=UPI003DA2F012